jgi:hypothetical protein
MNQKSSLREDPQFVSELLTANKTVSFNGATPVAIDSILINPYVEAADPYNGGSSQGDYSYSYVYENPVQPAGYALDGYGIVFTYGPSDYQIHVWGLHDPQLTAVDPATTTDPNFSSQFDGDFLLDPTPTPLPATLPLFAGGLGLTGMMGRRRKKQAAKSR